jgi:hypothetical protein
MGDGSRAFPGPSAKLYSAIANLGQEELKWRVERGAMTAEVLT